MKQVIKVIGVIIVTGIVIWTILMYNKKINISMNCNGNEQQFVMKRGDEFSCTMMNQEWKLKIRKIEDNEVILESQKEGLTELKEDGTTNLVDKQTKFILKKDEPLELRTQTTDIQGSIIFECK